MAWMNRTRRLRRICLHPAELLNLMGNWRHADCLALPVMSECRDEKGERFLLPANYEILAVDADPISRYVTFLVTHPDFPEVPEGVYVPYLVLTQVVVHGLKCVPGREDADRPITVSGVPSLSQHWSEVEQEMWSLFHQLWDRDVGTPGYDKEKWKRLEAAILAPKREASSLPRSLASSDRANELRPEESSCRRVT